VIKKKKKEKGFYSPLFGNSRKVGKKVNTVIHLMLGALKR